MEYTAAATHTTGVRKSKDFPPKAVRKSNDGTPRTYSKVKRDTPKMCSKSMDLDTPLSSVKYKDVSVKFSSKSTDVDPSKFSGKFKDASVKFSSKSVDVDPPRSSGKYKDGSVKSSGKSIGVDAPKTIVVTPKSSSKYKDGSVKSSSKSTMKTLEAIMGAPKSSSGKYRYGLVKSSSKYIGKTPKSIVDAPKSSAKYKESSMKSHSKSIFLDSPRSSGKHKDVSGKASIKPMDVDIPKSSFKSKDGSMKTSDGTAKGGPKTKPKGDVILQTVGIESTFDGSSKKGKGKVRAARPSRMRRRLWPRYRQVLDWLITVERGRLANDWSSVSLLQVPLGVVLAIPPFNYPFYLAVSKIAPALIAGSALVLKPPTQGLISCITCKGSEIGNLLTMHPGINCISFTGGHTGISISKKAGMVPMQMELGGKDGCIVLDNTDPDLAASNIAKGGFSYSGQRCTAVKLVLVMESVADVIVEKVKSKMKKLTVGAPEGRV